MATQSNTVAHIGPAWNRFEVTTFNGTYDTHINDGSDYDTLTLAEIFNAKPGNYDKTASPAFIPSSYCGHDAREHARQRAEGSFVALCGDVDEGDIAPERIESLVRGFCDEAAWLIFSTSHARPGNMRWRIIIPLETPASFLEWYDAQLAFFEFMREMGVIMDPALARAAQPVYLPNVPDEHAKTGTPLRNEEGKPLYYRRKATPLTAPGLQITTGPISAYLSIIYRQREADETRRERMRIEAEEKRKNRPVIEGAVIIEEFNRSTGIDTLLAAYGYEQSPRDERDWRSPYQTGETYATRIMDGGKWVSLSGSDTGMRIGAQFLGGCYGDAYDLYVHYQHGGDHKAAFRALHAERRAALVTHHSPPPPVQHDDPGPQEEDLEAMDDVEPVYDVVEIEANDADPDLLPFFDAADFKGQAIVEREWGMEGWEPKRSCIYLTGAGAVGKSLFTQQRLTCSAASLPFLGVPVTPGISLYISCEDDLAEMHRRQASINAALGITWDQLRGRLFLVSLKGMLNKEICVFDNEDRLKTTERWTMIQATINHLGATHVGLDNVAHLFTGNENIRNQVAAFTGLLDGEAERINGVILLLGHPNKAGDEYSGSTAWENQVRARIFLGMDKAADGSILDPDARILTNSKPNYSKRGDALHFRWHKWAFLRAEDMAADYAAELDASIRASAENEAFLRCLRARQGKAGREVGPKMGPSWAPARLSEMTEAKGYDKAAFKRAMERLLSIGAIVTEEVKNPKNNRWATIIREAE